MSQLPSAQDTTGHPGSTAEAEQPAQGPTEPKEPALPSVGCERVEARQAPPGLEGERPTGFARVSVRPPGSRYGDGDLVPGGSPDSGMVMDAAGVRRMVDGRWGSGDPADHIRFDPMFPGQAPPNFSQPRPWGPPGAGRGRTFPGEPDPDHLAPLQGGPHQPFGGPGGGQFGPRSGRGFGGGFGPGGFC